MKKRNLSFENEHEPSLAQVRAMVGEVTTSASR
jgi:hypothetical protein